MRSFIGDDEINAFCIVSMICYEMANHAVHLRAAFCDVWCNRVVRRRGFMRPLHAALHRASRGRGHLHLKKHHCFLSRALCEVRCKRIVRHSFHFDQIWNNGAYANSATATGRCTANDCRCNLIRAISCAVSAVI